MDWCFRSSYHPPNGSHAHNTLGATEDTGKEGGEPGPLCFEILIG